jgi:hypothetical protein
MKCDFLTQYPIESVSATALHDALDKNRICDIDPLTILPEKNLSLPGKFTPLFNIAESLEIFEEADALAFDFYQSNERRLITAFRIPRLLNYTQGSVDNHEEEAGDKIWRKLKKLFLDKSKKKHHEIDPSKLAIVTTYDRDDLLFKEYIEAKLGRDPFTDPNIIVPRTEAVGGNARFFLFSRVRELQGPEQIFLLLANAHTSEVLRELVTLIAAESTAKKITVVCLVNRMGYRLSGFVARIRKMLGGLGGSNMDTDFQFVSVFDVSDFGRNEINKMHQSVHTLLANYASNVHVARLSALLQEEAQYFEFKHLTSHKFREGQSKHMFDDYVTSIGKKSISAKTVDSKLFLICAKINIERDYRPILNEIKQVLNEIRQEDNKRNLYLYFAMLLLDINYIKSVTVDGMTLGGSQARNSILADIRNAIIEGVRQMRQERLRVERAFGPGRPIDPFARGSIEQKVALETQLLFGLSLLCFMDTGFDYLPIFKECLGWDLTVEQWLELDNSRSRLLYQENIEAQFMEERWGLVISMLAHFSGLKKRSDKTKDEIITWLSDLSHGMDRVLHRNAYYLSDGTKRVLFGSKSLLSDIRNDIENVPKTERYQIIRALHAMITTPKGHHNPIANSLLDVAHTLDTKYFVITNNQPLAPDEPLEIPRNHQIEVRKVAADGLSVAGQLEDISAKLCRLFEFTSFLPPEETRRYTDGANVPESFARDASRLGALCRIIRNENNLRGDHIDEIKGIVDRFTSELFPVNVEPVKVQEDSPALRALRYYVTPLIPTLLKAMDYADSDLARERDRRGRSRPALPDVWAKQREIWTSRQSDSAYMGISVLIDAPTLEEILKNLLTNVRYQLDGFDLPSDKSWGDQVELEISKPVADVIRDDSTGERVNYITVTVNSFGHPLEQEITLPESTLTTQRSEVIRYGGKLNGPKPLTTHLRVGATCELKLISRRNVRGENET